MSDSPGGFHCEELCCGGTNGADARSLGCVVHRNRVLLLSIGAAGGSSQGGAKRRLWGREGGRETQAASRPALKPSREKESRGTPVVEAPGRDAHLHVRRHHF